MNPQDKLKRAFKQTWGQQSNQKDLSLDQMFASASHKSQTKPKRDKQTTLNLSSTPKSKYKQQSKTAVTQNEPKYITVSELDKELYNDFKTNNLFNNFYITGGISGIKKYRYVWYFTLDDPHKNKVSMSGEIPKYVVDNLPFNLQNGMKVDIVASLTMSRKYGETEIKVKRIMPKGISALYLQVAKTKRELAQAGYFNPAHKKPIPMFPHRVAVITSSAGAVIRDIIDTIRDRFPIVQVVLFPTAVAGTRAVQGMIHQIHHVDEIGNFDTVIIGRVGCSKKDLQVFNDKQLALAIYHCNTPIIASVGHGIDTEFIANFMADKQGDTPTMAADLATPVRMNDLIQQLKQWKQISKTDVAQHINDAKQQVHDLMSSSVMQHPEQMIVERRQQLQLAQDKIASQMQHKLTNVYQNWTNLHTDMIKCNPRNVLNKYIERLQLLRQQQKSAIQTNIQQRNSQYQQILVQYQQINLRQELVPKVQALQSLKQQFSLIIKNKVQHQKDTLQETLNLLKQLSPKTTMKRGYSYVTNMGDVIKDVSQLKPHETVKLHFYHGEANAKITRRFHTKSNNKKKESNKNG